jgi:hypothetical protein
MKFASFLFFLVFSVGLKAQNNPPLGPPKTTSETNFECDVVLDIYDAFVDWKASPPKFWGGKNSPKSTIDKLMVGALCVANKNDTNGNGIIDDSENNVVNASHRNEIDLMKLVLRPRENGNILSGNITLSKESGNNIKIWTTPEKAIGTQINLPLTINATTLPKTWYIEATEPSTSVRDIIISATYQGKKEIVKATAVWVVLEETYDNASDNPDINALGVGGCIKGRIKNNISPDGTKFGFGPFGIGKTEKIGSRILFQWRLLPSDAYNIVQVDGTRQRSTKNWSVNMDLISGPDCKFVLKTEPFPFDANEDIEMPNDDKSNGPEEDEKCDDNKDVIQQNGRFFTYDAPSVATKEEFILDPPKFPLWRAFVDDKTNFNEFIRLGPKDTEFNPPVKSSGLLIGSRASDKIPWSNAYYTKKDKTFTLVQDDTPIGLNHLRVNNMKDDHTNYPIEYTTNLTTTSYQLGTYSIFIFRDETEKAYTAVRLVPSADGGCLTEESTIGTIPLATNPYSIAFEQHLIEIKEINAINDILFLNWHTFQSPNKLNIVSGNSHITNLNH